MSTLADIKALAEHDDDRRIELRQLADRRWEATLRWDPEPAKYGAKPGHMTFVFGVPTPLIQIGRGASPEAAIDALKAVLA